MKFYIREKIFSIGDSFSIKDVSGNDVFIVEGRIFSFGNKLRIYDMYNNEILNQQFILPESSKRLNNILYLESKNLY